eukprot:CAMPEP_0176076060 /NCGR_PEP_ID=MMETSP0120_2-20121206/38020_1 /TAXON_ID=160619 /ORGANISM="Kryptoperidinium foliaceum, Strain CCMP 1326" /LENGTH=230 /DNA_ID=CAMNT_0017409773 /DNA_START=1 /DNA_END=693 /DNA_ORIENTATION=+
MRDAMEDIVGAGAVAGSIAGLAQGAYQPDRVVAAPAGRQRAARVAECGSLGGGPGQRPPVVVPYETMRRSFDSGAPKSPNPLEAWRSVTTRCQEEFGASARNQDIIADPAGAVLGGGGFIWIALKGMNREPVGCIALHRHKDDSETTWELGELSVLVDSRRQGVGKQLVDMLLRQYQEAAGTGEPLWLRVPSAFEASSPFFERMGFEGDTASDTDGGGLRMVYRGARAPQ